MMIRPPVQHFDVQIRARMIDEAAEEILYQLGLQIADQACFDEILVYQGRAPTQINCGDCQSLGSGSCMRR